MTDRRDVREDALLVRVVRSVIDPADGETLEALDELARRLEDSLAREHHLRAGQRRRSSSGQ